MRIAILGGGFAGLAVTWYLQNYTQGSISVDLFDPSPIGAGASGLSSGLLHPYTGRHARLAWEAERSMRETHRLITVASSALGQPIILSKGILRPALNAQQISDFQACATLHGDTEWWDKQRCVHDIPHLHLPPDGGGLYIKESFTLDVKNYLMGLWQACARHGTQYQKLARISSHELEHYDRVLIAMGAETRNFPPLKDLPIAPVKGQILELKWPENITPLPFSLVSRKYIVMRPHQKSCIVGATYEHHFTTAKPELATAAEQIMPDIQSFLPALSEPSILGVYSAFRASSPNHLPLVGKVSDKYYFFTALGSKGLLHHAWIAKRVARALLSGETRHFPEKLHYTLPSSAF